MFECLIKIAVQHERGPRTSTVRRQLQGMCYSKDRSASNSPPLDLTPKRSSPECSSTTSCSTPPGSRYATDSHLYLSAFRPQVRTHWLYTQWSKWNEASVVVSSFERRGKAKLYHTGSCYWKINEKSIIIFFLYERPTFRPIPARVPAHCQHVAKNTHPVRRQLTSLDV